MILKQVIRYTNAPAIEATWVRYDQMPDVEVPASPALYDKDGNEVQVAVEAHTRPGEVIETVLKCHAYSNHPEQIAMLRADLGANAAEHEGLIAEVEATYTPPPPTPAAEVWERIKAERDRRAALGVKVGAHWFHSDQKSRTQQLALTSTTLTIPADLQWKTLTFTPPPVFVTMTRELAIQIVQATAESDTAIFTAAEIHRMTMEAQADPGAYDFTGGWPASIEDEAHDAGIQFNGSAV
ncbi:DUF4376 domain-containing protein [Diaphorobacter sp. ED-3]|uniref:DUF4376 domain-containing protein n=1 Tax=Diaphorobacter sp. ED-3 TaxID=3016636 RepID=UPI0022DE7BD0|nr:DUF4376 domain-containing protein [Diaphorobacter sp. ED-3]